MDLVKHIIEGVGEVGIDTEASPGNGNWYVLHYATEFNVVGFDSKEEAIEELLYVEANQDSEEFDDSFPLSLEYDEGE